MMEITNDTTFEEVFEPLLQMESFSDAVQHMSKYAAALMLYNTGLNEDKAYALAYDNLNQYFTMKADVEANKHINKLFDQ